MNETLAFKKLVRCSNYRFEAIRQDVSGNATQKESGGEEGYRATVVTFLSMAPQLLVYQGLLFVEVSTLHSLTHTHTR